MRKRTLRISQDEFQRRIKKEQTNPRLNFNKSIFTGINNPVEVECKEHGEYKTKATNLLHGKTKHSCPDCRIEMQSQAKRELGKKNFLIISKKKHGTRYNYSKVVYVDASTPVIIGCSVHGFFKCTPNSHTSSGTGCPDCYVVYKNRNNEKSKLTRRIKNSVSSRILAGLFFQGVERRKHYNEILGTTYDNYREYLEAKFEDWMTWDNYGMWHPTERRWQIDHIKAVANHNLSDEVELLKAFNYKNTQPLSARENYRKSNKY